MRQSTACGTLWCMKRQLSTTSCGVVVEVTGAQRHRERSLPQAPLPAQVSSMLYAATSRPVGTLQPKTIAAARAKLQEIRSKRA